MTRVQCVGPTTYSLRGVEIADGARSVLEHPFAPRTALLVGSEARGMQPEDMALCDGFVFVPQHSQLSASLSVGTATAVVLHHFATWAQLPVADRSGHKFASAGDDAEDSS